jgi:hypothetical protein
MVLVDAYDSKSDKHLERTNKRIEMNIYLNITLIRGKN